MMRRRTIVRRCADRFSLPNLTALIISLVALSVSGCRHPLSKNSQLTNSVSGDTQVAPGVILRTFAAGSEISPHSDAVLLDVDLTVPGVRVAVASEGTVMRKGRVYGNSYRVAEWCRRLEAVGGINGGFFGLTDGDRKEFIGLLASGGTIISPGRIVRPAGNRQKRVVRSVFGIDKQGVPHIGWGVGERGRAALLTEYLTPLDPTEQRYWNVDCAVACGPRLIRAGKTQITDRDERLASPPPLRRTFVGFDTAGGRPAHLALAVAGQMTFQDAADLLTAYFRKYHKSACSEAMALDGGASTQLAYRNGSGFADSMITRVTVPSAVVVYAKGTR